MKSFDSIIVFTVGFLLAQTVVQCYRVDHLEDQIQVLQQSITEVVENIALLDNDLNNEVNRSENYERP